MSIFKKGAVGLATVFCLMAAPEARAQYYAPEPLHETGRAMQQVVTDGFEAGRKAAPWALGTTVVLGLGAVAAVAFDKRQKKLAAQPKPPAPKAPVPQP